MVAGVQANHRVYACGPNRLIDELEALGAEWPEQVLHYEHFSGEGSGLQPDKEHAFVAVLKDSGLEVTVPLTAPCCRHCRRRGGRALRLRRRPVRHLRGGRGVWRGRPPRQGAHQAERAANTRLLACCSRAAGQKVVLAL